jgi:hypothetical protein
MQRVAWITVVVLLSVKASGLRAEEAAAIVSNIKVLSDKQPEDVSSIEAWKKSVLKDGMTDEQKAMAAWLTTVKFRHHDATPMEFVGMEGSVNDAIKQFNVYGYGPAPTGLLTLARHAGLEARCWTLWRWGGGTEVKFDNEWHFLDPGMICYFKKPDGKIAGVEDLSKVVQDWYKQNPGYFDREKDKEPNLEKLRKEKKLADMPALVQSCPTYDKGGSFMFYYFGWYSTMLLFSAPKGSSQTPFQYEESYSEGYRVNIQLRHGEKLVRNWSNKGLHVNMTGGGGTPELIKAQVGPGQLLYYTPAIGDLSNGRIGNGSYDYDLPLTELRTHAISCENIATSAEDKLQPAIHAKDPAASATFVLRRPCSYVYLGGKLNFDAKVGEGGELLVEFSDNNGLKWTEIAKVTASGPQSIDLQSRIIRKYDYRLKFTLKGKGTGLDSLKITTDIQHSQRPLPALGQGENTITFDVGPNEGTITIEPTQPSAKDKQPSYEDFGAKIENMTAQGTLIPSAGGRITIPIETPYDMTCLRFGCNYRAVGAEEGFDLQVSFDDGKTFKTVDRAKGPTRQNAKWVAVTDIPAGTKKALVRYAGDPKGNLILFRLRIDADYKESAAFIPVKVTYEWEENGQPKQDVHIAKAREETYKIKCDAKPKMKSITLELAE